MYLSVIAFVFGVLGVWLTIRQTIWCWPVALVAVVASIAEFYNERLFGDMCLQIFYFFAGIYGWVYWNQNKDHPFHVRRMDLKAFPTLIIVTALQAVLYYYLLLYFRGDKPFLDAILTACSLTVTYMMTKKWVENWFAWVLIDLVYVLLYVIKDMWLFSLLNLFMAGVAFYGWLKWRKLT
jgi:nicotinamide mononucleotide transporter